VGQGVRVTVDTASQFLTFPCKSTCTPDKCGGNQWFDTQNVGSPVESSKCPLKIFQSNGHCESTQTFTDGSSVTAEGYKMQLNGSWVYVGCHLEEKGLMLTGPVNGLMGLAPFESDEPYGGFVDEVLRSRTHQAFSISLLDRGGTLVLGVDPGAVRHRNTLEMTRGNSKWLVHLNQWKLEWDTAKKRNIGPQNIGHNIDARAYVDSASAWTYFPEAMGEDILKSISSYCRQNAICQRFPAPDNCFTFRYSEAYDMFPPLTLSFRTKLGNSITYTWSPREYAMNKGEKIWCTAFLKWKSDYVALGASWMLNKKLYFIVDGGGLLVEPLNLAVQPAQAWKQEMLMGSCQLVAQGRSTRCLGLVFPLALVSLAIALTCCWRRRRSPPEGAMPLRQPCQGCAQE